MHRLLKSGGGRTKLPLRGEGGAEIEAGGREARLLGERGLIAAHRVVQTSLALQVVGVIGANPGQRRLQRERTAIERVDRRGGTAGAGIGLGKSTPPVRPRGVDADRL